MVEYKHFELLNVYGDQYSLDKKIKAFQKIGWVRVANLNIDQKPNFITLGWPSAKGDPVYPIGYKKN